MEIKLKFIYPLRNEIKVQNILFKINLFDNLKYSYVFQKLIKI